MAGRAFPGLPDTAARVRAAVPMLGSPAGRCRRSDHVRPTAPDREPEGPERRTLPPAARGPYLGRQPHRSAGRGPARLKEGTGWAYTELGFSICDVFLETPVTSLHRVFAPPGATSLTWLRRSCVTGRTQEGECGAEWSQAYAGRCEAFRRHRAR